MSHIITVKCQNPTCGRIQKMELRKCTYERRILMLIKKSKVCVFCHRRFKVDGRSVVST